MTISRRISWDGKPLAANGGDEAVLPDEALHNSAVVGSSNAPVGQEPAASDPDGDEATGPTPPPKGGAGSGLAEWQAYADLVGVKYDEDTTRDEIIAAVEAAAEG